MSGKEQDLEKRRDGSSEGSGEEDELPVLSLVAGRERRAGAGARMRQVIGTEEDQQLGLLDEEEADGEFEESEEEQGRGADERMDTSSDEDEERLRKSMGEI